MILENSYLLKIIRETGQLEKRKHQEYKKRSVIRELVYPQ